MVSRGREKMPRPLRAADGGVIYHVLNRANGRAKIFESDGDYAAFEQVLVEGCQRTPIRLFSYCLMPNHWHMALLPVHDGDLSRFVGWVTMTHAQRWHAAHGTTGHGHLYQGRFKSFPVQGDRHFQILCRYVEANALRAGLSKKAQDWRWCSLSRRGTPESDTPPLHEWPVPRPLNWLELVNERRPPKEAEGLRISMQRGRPFGGERWTAQMCQRLGLQSTVRQRGRPWPKSKGS